MTNDNDNDNDHVMTRAAVKRSMAALDRARSHHHLAAQDLELLRDIAIGVGDLDACPAVVLRRLDARLSQAETQIADVQLGMQYQLTHQSLRKVKRGVDDWQRYRDGVMKSDRLSIGEEPIQRASELSAGHSDRDEV